MSENAIIVNQVIKRFGNAKHNNWIKNFFNKKAGSNGHKGSTPAEERDQRPGDGAEWRRPDPARGPACQNALASAVDRRGTHPPGPMGVQSC